MGGEHEAWRMAEATYSGTTVARGIGSPRFVFDLGGLTGVCVGALRALGWCSDRPIGVSLGPHVENQNAERSERARERERERKRHL